MPRNADEEVEKIVRGVIGEFYYVYNRLGYGFREKIYANALERVLTRRGFAVRRDVVIRVLFEGQAVGWDVADMVVNDVLIIENKAGRRLDPTAPEQLMNYLRGTELENGVLLYFGPKPWFYRQHIPNTR